MRTFKRTYPRTDSRYKSTRIRLRARKIRYISDYLSWETEGVAIVAFTKTERDIPFLKHLNFKEENKGK